MRIFKIGSFFLFAFFWSIFLSSQLSPVYAIEYGGIGGRPAYPRVDEPRSESIIIHNILVGEVIQDGITIINNTTFKKTLLIYATDDTPSTDGGYACKQLSEPKVKVGTWITLEKSEVTLNPGTSELVKFVINVPAVLDVGEHNGCLVVQEKLEASQAAGVNLSLRTALRILLTVPGDVIRLLELTSFEVIDRSATTILLKPMVTNKGNISVDATINVNVTNSITREIITYGGGYSVLTNNPLVINFEFFKPLFGGFFYTQAIVSYNNGQTDNQIFSDIITFFVWPQLLGWVYIILIILPIVLFIIFLIYKKKRKKNQKVVRKKRPRYKIIK